MSTRESKFVCLLERQSDTAESCREVVSGPLNTSRMEETIGPHLLPPLGCWGRAGRQREEFLVAASLINKYWFLTYLQYVLDDELSHIWPPAGRGEQGRDVGGGGGVLRNKETIGQRQKACIPVVYTGKHRTHKNRYALGPHTRNVYDTQWFSQRTVSFFRQDESQRAWTVIPPPPLSLFPPISEPPPSTALTPLIAGWQLIRTGRLMFTAVALLSRKLR